MTDNWIQFVNTGVVPVGLALIMFSLGLTLALRDFALVVRRPLLVGSGFATHIFVLPLLGLGIGVLFQLPPEMALGLFIISLCPAGTTSNALTFVGRGNVALAVVLTALTSLVTIFTIPLILSSAVPWFLERGGRPVPALDPIAVIRQLAMITALPIAIGMIVRHFSPGLVARLARGLRPTAFIILVVVIGFSIWVALDMVLDNLVRATPAILALNLTAMAFGLLLGRMIGVGARDSMTLAIETGVQNVTLAIYLTLTVLGSLPLAVTQNIYGVVMLTTASLLIRARRRRIQAETDAA